MTPLIFVLRAAHGNELARDAANRRRAKPDISDIRETRPSRVTCEHSAERCHWLTFCREYPDSIPDASVSSSVASTTAAPIPAASMAADLTGLAPVAK
jgi:hypothetical protein